ncbi:WASH complex subunit 3 [Lingula anatina]|uniref:WASH complex subunit 3 n=1 Tax=Lingula anatina TaxID=7574 RepID=A0A1S3K343_LINAN|nr:WASH complex subunit 3 [Lingula anatina]|eukprot:XP_013416681.1 WASH complex subunit 3 [Lingula anatina]
MDEDGLPLVGPGVDFTKVGAIHHKRTVAFLNHFVIHTSRFLNRFSCVCEEKLMHLSTRIQRLETTMNMLETKISSIPGLENITAPASSAPSSGTADTQAPPGTAPAAPPAPPPAGDSAAPTAAPNAEQPAQTEEPQPEKPKMTVSQDPRYTKYFKMVTVGVPAAAVRPKMLAEGLNPDLLETPDAPAPEGEETKNKDDDASDFSDSASDDSSGGFSD